MRFIKTNEIDTPSFFEKFLVDETLIAALHERLRKNKSITVCDIGCGYPRFMISLNEKYYSFISLVKVAFEI